MLESDPLAKNRVEFQWESKLLGTNSKALAEIGVTLKT